eukprot:9389173-Alexandrium_andersonii.AAC.1
MASCRGLHGRLRQGDRPSVVRPRSWRVRSRGTCRSHATGAFRALTSTPAHPGQTHRRRVPTILC